MMRKILFTSIILIASLIIVQVINHSIIEKVIFGDSCEHNTGTIKTDGIFNLFYTVSSNTGYHPEPSLFNFMFTTSVGLIMGVFFSYKLLWKVDRIHSTSL